MVIQTVSVGNLFFHSSHRLTYESCTKKDLKMPQENVKLPVELVYSWSAQVGRHGRALTTRPEEHSGS